MLAEELPVLPTVILDSFPRSYPGLPLAGLYHVAANALSVWGGALDPRVRTWKATGSGTGPYGCWPVPNAAPWR